MSGIDADFDVYRNAIKKNLVALIKLFPENFLDFVDLLFSQVAPLPQFANTEWRTAEAIVNLLFCFGDGFKVNVASPLRGRSFVLLSLQIASCSCS